MKSRKQAWMRDELILALDLYLREGPSASLKSREELSASLRAIPVEPELCANPKFRSPQAIAYKLHNFVGIDPSSAAAGFPHGGKGDQLVWDEFAADRSRLGATAAAIQRNLGAINQDEAEAIDEEISDAEEGKVLTRVHRQRERNSKLRKAKIKQALDKTGRLACEACDLDFSERYGQRGAGFIECHHIQPLHALKPGQKTKLSDLALLCSNCHRMVHVRPPWLSLDELRQIQGSQLASATPAAA